MSATPFVNRQDELDFLGFALRRAHGGQGQVVAVVGDPGVGKSRLLVELRRLCGERGFRVLAGEALPGGELTSHLAAAAILRALFGLADGDDARQSAARVSAAVAGLPEAFRGALPAVLAVLDLPSDDAAWPGLDGSVRRQRILAAVTDLLTHASRAEPVLVLCESLQWIDPETQACLDALVERLPGTRILLAVSHRPEYAPPWGSLPYYNPLRIEPLSEAAAALMLAALLGPDPRLRPVTKVLVEHTAGNPLFIEECVRALGETGVLGRGAEPAGAAPLTEIEGLATVQAVLASRLRRLVPADRALLEVASTIGAKVAVAVLEAVAGLPAEALAAGLTRLEAAEFLQQTGPFPGVEVSFRQAMMHEVVYGQISADRRRALHARALQAMEELGPDHPAARPDVLGEHAFRGEVWPRAVVHLRQAGLRAAARAANGEAVARLGQALAALARLPDSVETLAEAIDLRLELRPPLLQLGRLAEVLETSREAEALARRAGDEARLARVYTYLANYHYLKGEPEAAIDYGQRCVEIGRAQADPPLVALARAYMGYSLHAQGRYGEARAVLSENLDMLEPLRQVRTSPQTAVSHVGSAAWLAFTLAELGEFEPAEGAAAAARQIAEATRNPYSQAIATTLAGLVWLVRGQLDRALPLLEASLATCRDKQLTVWQPVPSSLCGIALARAGRVDRALPLLEDGVARTAALGVKAYLSRWTVHLAEGLLAAGHRERAAAEAETALALAARHRERGHEAEALRLLGEIDGLADPPEAARGEERLRGALAIAVELGMRPLVARVHLALGALARRAGRTRDGQRDVVGAIALGRTMGLGLWLDAAVAELRALGTVFVLPPDAADLHAFLAGRWAADADVRVVLDRRRSPRAGARAGAPPPTGVVVIEP